MFIVSRKHFDEHIRPAKERYLKIVSRWTEEALNHQQKLIREAKAGKSGTELRFYEAAEQLFLTFTEDTSPFYYRELLSLRYDEMEPIWKTFLDSDQMKNVLAVFKEQGASFLETASGAGEPISYFMDSDTYKKKLKGKGVADTAIAQLHTWYAAFLKYLQDGFSYEKLSRGTKEYGAYDLCRDLGIHVCIYCNANYTYTMQEEGRKISRPALDHYMMKSGFPIFRLTFDNLFPSCNICNSSIKGDRLMLPSGYLHPYQEGYGEETHVKIDFTFRPDQEKSLQFYPSAENSIEIKEKIGHTLEFFETNEVYQSFHEQVMELWDKSQKYDLDYLKEVMGIIRDKGMEEDTYFLRDLFGYIEKEEAMNTTLGEIRHEITGQIIDNLKSGK